MELTALSQLFSTKIFIILNNTLKHGISTFCSKQISSSYGLPLSLNIISEALQRAGGRDRSLFPPEWQSSNMCGCWKWRMVSWSSLLGPPSVESLLYEWALEGVIKAPVFWACQAWRRASPLWLGAEWMKEVSVLSAALSKIELLKHRDEGVRNADGLPLLGWNCSSRLWAMERMSYHFLVHTIEE